MDAGAALAELKTRFVSYGGDRPAIALAIRWCEDHLPAPTVPVLVHGDYRMGNIMVDVAKEREGGLAAVLDWELAHLGDWHEDLAFGCMTVWRFGQLDRPAFGVGSLEEYFAAYAAAGGAPVDRGRFRFWLVYRTLWWALGCLQRSEEHTSELQSLMRISYAVFCLNKNININRTTINQHHTSTPTIQFSRKTQNTNTK